MFDLHYQQVHDPAPVRQVKDTEVELGYYQSLVWCQECNFYTTTQDQLDLHCQQDHKPAKVATDISTKEGFISPANNAAPVRQVKDSEDVAIKPAALCVSKDYEIYPT